MPFQDEMEKKQQKSFAEIYKITIGTKPYFYTSYEKKVTFESNDYTPAPIKRSSFSFDEKLSAKRIKISAPLSEPVRKFIANSPPEDVEIIIYRVLVEDTAQFRQIFKGEIINVTMTKNGADIDCESSSLVFRNKLPIITHQAFCNHRLYDSGCTLNPDSFKTVAVVTVNASDLVAAIFATKPDGYFTLGHVITQDGDKRLITNHVGNTITLQVPFDARVATLSQVNVFAGCDKNANTCRNKFSNFNNFVGFPFIPSNNPVVWGVDKD